jgi:low temperature requirement protein LtrA
MAAIALVVSFSIWWLYFEGVSASEIRLPTDRASAGRYQLWMFSHVPLHMAIVAGAIGMEHAMHLKSGEAFHGPEGTILAAVSFAVMLCMHLLFNAALPKDAARLAASRSWPHFILTGLTGGMMLVADRFTGLGLVSTLMGLFLLHVLMTLRERAPRVPKRDADISDYMAWWDGG